MEKAVYIAMRRDLNMTRGKEIAQAVHAFAALAADDGGPVICVRAEDEAGLVAMVTEAGKANVFCAPIIDAGRTMFAEPTLRRLYTLQT